MSESANRSRAQTALAILALGALCFAIFGPALLNRERSLSHISGDTSQFFFAMRDFGADEIRAGRLPLWNPYLMSGTPFVGNFQSALFYPPNALYLVLPVADAADADYTLHAFLSALFTFFWARRRGVSRLGGVLAGAIAMFGSPFFLRMLGGQLTMVDAMAWAPLLFLAIEMVFDAARERRSLAGPVFLGAAATAMQMLAGHPQTVFITGFTAAMYCLLRFPGATNRIRVSVALAIFAIWGTLIASVQLLPGFQTMSESIRTGGVGTDFATTFSFPPENLITLIAPAFFGDRVYRPYWGQWASWDAVLFFGISGLVLAIYGARHATASQRRYAPFLVVLILFLAMGRYNPVYDVFAAIPVFSVLRGVSKFLFVGTLFAALLAGMGYDLLAARPPAGQPRRATMLLIAILPALALGMIAIGMSAFIGGGELWRQFSFRQMADSLFVGLWFEPANDFFVQSATWAIISLATAAVTMLLIAILLWRTNGGPLAARGILLVGLIELSAFAYAYCDTFAVADMHPREVEAFYAEHADGDYRVAQLRGPNVPYARNFPMDVRRSAVWGYEPVMLHRHAMFVAHGVGGGIPILPQLIEHVRWGTDLIEYGLNAGFDTFSFDVDNRRFDPPRALDMLRCRYALVPEGLPKSAPGIFENPDTLPRFLLVRDFMVLEIPRVILETMSEDTFDPRRTVVLEQAPVPAPDPSSGVTNADVVVEDESSDHMTLRVTLDAPAILLVTDPYSAGWGTVALADSVQQSYVTLPADYALRAVPLEAGAHHLRMEYRPRAFVLGVLISLIAVTAYGAAFAYWATSLLAGYLTKKAA